MAAKDRAEKLEPFVEDYRIRVFDIAFLDDAVIDCFTSDFKVVARFFKNKRLGRQAEVSQDRQTLTHVEALMDLFSAFTNDNRYREAYERTLRFMVERGEAVDMCSVIDYYVEKGMEQGIEQGIELATRRTITRMLQAGKTPEQIAEFCGYPMAQVESVQEALLQKA